MAYSATKRNYKIVWYNLFLVSIMEGRLQKITFLRRFIRAIASLRLAAM